MFQTTMEALRDQATKVDDDHEYLDVLISECKFVNDEGKLQITNNDRVIHSCDNSRNELMKGLVSGLPQFELNLLKKSPTDWIEVLEKVQRLNSDKLMTFLLNKKTDSLIHVVPTTWVKTTAHQVLDKVDEFLDVDKEFELRSGEVGHDRIDVHVTHTRNFAMDKAPEDDLFRQHGFFFSHEFGSRPSIGAALERMVCGNGMRRVESGSSAYLGMSEAVAPQVHRIYSKLPTPSVHRMLGICGSFREVRDSYQRIKNIVDEAINTHAESPVSEAKLDELIPFKMVASKYGIDPGDRKPDIWGMTAETPIKAYDLFNAITWVASNCKNLNSRKSAELMVHGGSLMVRDWDLSNIAPKINWN